MHKAIEVQVAQTGSMPLKRAMELAQDATDQGDVDTRTVLLFDINDRHANARNLSIDFLEGRVPVLGIFAVRYCPQYEAYCLDGQNLGMVNSLLEFSSADISVSRRMHAPFKQSHGPVQPDLTFVLQGTFKAVQSQALSRTGCQALRASFTGEHAPSMSAQAEPWMMGNEKKKGP